MSGLLRRWRLAEAYRRVWKTPDGRRVLSDLMLAGYPLRMSFAPGDPHQTSFNEGMRRLGMRIADMLNMKEPEIQDLIEQRSAEDGEEA